MERIVVERAASGRWLVPALTLLYLLVLLLLGSCSAGNPFSGTTTELASRGGRWAVVIYVAADNDLEAQAIEDINELEAAGIAGSEVTVVALVDRAPGYDSSNGDWTGTRLYEIANDPGGMNDSIVSIPLSVPELGITVGGADAELNMGDPATLSALLDFARTRYEPDHLGLILWGHGSGYRAGVREPIEPNGSRATSFDDSSSGDALLTAELGGALSTAGVSLLGLDLCFGAGIELAYELRSAVPIMVASQGLIPADGWEYDDLFIRFLASDLSPRAFGTSIVESFAASASTQAGATIASIDLNEIGNVNSALNEFATGLEAQILTDALRSEVRAKLFYSVEDFYATPGDLNIDLGHMAKVIGDEFDLVDTESARLASAVDRAIIDRWTGSAALDATGLSVHLVPLESDGSAAASHDNGYLRDSGVEYGLEFVRDSTWPPSLSEETGLLYRLFYEVLP
ncbi:MAG: clostripain-related cysteine peptidase [Spirochaetales bacterium]